MCVNVCQHVSMCVNGCQHTLKTRCFDIWYHLRV
jgi:hypothetical protein